MQSYASPYWKSTKASPVKHQHCTFLTTQPSLAMLQPEVFSAML